MSNVTVPVSPHAGQASSSSTFANGSSSAMAPATASRTGAGIAAGGGSRTQRVSIASRALATSGSRPAAPRSSVVGSRKRTSNPSTASSCVSPARGSAPGSSSAASNESSSNSPHAGQSATASTSPPNASALSARSSASRRPTLRSASSSASRPGARPRSRASGRAAGGLCRPSSHTSSNADGESAGTGGLALREARLRRLDHRGVPLEAFRLELEVLDQDGVGVRVQVGERLVLGRPAAKQLVGERELPGLVVDLEDDVLAEVLERHLGAETGAVVPDLVRPRLELGVVRDAALERDRVVLRPAGRLAARAVVAALAMLDDLGRSLQRADLAHAGDVAPVPLHAELEVLVRVEPLRVDGELRHDARPPPGRPVAGS